MKTLFAILLTAASCFAQPRSVRNESPVLTYTLAQPDCAARGITDIMTQLSTGCFILRTQITVRSSNRDTMGFLVTITYRDSSDGQVKSDSKLSMIGVPVYLATVPSSGIGDFTASFAIGDSALISFSAIEVLRGRSIQ